MAEKNTKGNSKDKKGSEQKAVGTVVKKPFPLMDYLPFTVIFAGVWIFLFWKCRFGFGNIDESFYLTIPYRLCKGDSLFLNEWHLSQTSAILLMPLVRIYLLIKGDMTGAILAFRYIFTAVWGIAAYFCYYRLKKYSKPGAAAGALIFMIYAPFGIMALSYNSMGILYVLLAGVLIATSETHLRIQYTLAGLCLAASVLCCPYLVILYALYSLAVLAIFIRTKVINRKSEEKVKCEAAYIWFWVTVGCAALAAVFAVFVLSRASVSRIIEAFPTIMDDPEHPPLSIKDKTDDFFLSITDSWEKAAFCLNMTFIMIYISKVYKKYRGICLIVVCLLTAVYTNYFVTENIYLNFIMFPINMLGICAALVSDNKIVKKLFLLIWLPGIIYAYCINMSSNQYFFCISSASTVSAVASALMAVLYVKEILADKKENEKKYQRVLRFLPASVLAVLLVFQTAVEIKVRYSSIFWESGIIADKDTCIKEGPEKGLMVESMSEYGYSYTYNVIRPIFEGAYGKKVLYLTQSTWMYLCGDVENCTFSAWMSGITDQSVGRLMTYYELNPDKLPDVIYIEYYDGAIAAPFYGLGYTLVTSSTNVPILVKI